jgi:LAO/AO transport system kinase
MTESTPSQQRLLESFERGEARALARAISWVENARPGFEALLSALHERVGRAHRIGITGPPGAGKSTLIHALAGAVRKDGDRVGVVAVDPTSPFTGGALLGDRIRMTGAAGDEGIFIRSMASRGSLGGLATTTREVADLMDAFGFERVVIETVGVGQSELEIAGATDTTVVVLTPESGDSIQAMKAGLMEIADVFVLNKADRPEAKRAAGELKTILRIRQGQAFNRVPAHHGVDLSGMAKGRGAKPQTGDSEASDDGAVARRWRIPVLLTTAQSGEGIGELIETLAAHREYLVETGELEVRRRQRLMDRVRAVVDRGLRVRVWLDGRGEAILRESRGELESGQCTPYEIAARILESVETEAAQGDQSGNNG